MRRLGPLLTGLAVALGLVAALDPERPGVGVAAVFMALASLVACRHSTRRTFLACYALLLVIGAAAQPDYRRADFRTYFQYLQSAAFDHDLDFRDEAEQWNSRPLPETPVGRRPSDATCGAALLWSPFFVVAHAYAAGANALGVARFGLDGFSAPYFGSALAGTLFWSLLGAFALGRVIARRTDATVAAVAVAGAVGGSSILFYLFVQPGMSHGLVFGLLGLLLLAADDADAAPTPRAFALVGLLAGTLVLVRPQAALACVFLLPLAWRHRRTAPPRSWLAAMATAAVVFVPQLLAWRSIYGQWLPFGGAAAAAQAQLAAARPGFGRYSTWFDPASPHLALTLFGADRGLFVWTPLLLPALLALPFAVRRFGRLALGGVLAVALTFWFNGALSTLKAGDSYGARRFDVVVPFAALGLAVLLQAARRRPLAAPVLLLAGVVAWNAGLIRLTRLRLVTAEAASEDVARLQARQLRLGAEGVLGDAFGPRGRALAHEALAGDSLFDASDPDAVFRLGDPGAGYLAGGWSDAVNDDGPPRFRAAGYPRACVRFALMVAAPLEVTVTGRAPGRLASQPLRVSLNESVSDLQSLTPDWTDVSVRFPAEAALPGPNRLCLEFDTGTARPDGSGAAAQIRRIVVGSQTPVDPTPIWGLRGR